MGVAELVNRLGEGSPAEEQIVPREPISLLAQTPKRNERPPSRVIRKPEDEVKSPNKEVNVGDAETPGSP
jgi:hypothetical protein